MLKEQKNQKIELSREQAHPNLADPADFKVMNPADAAKMKVPACYNLDPAAYGAVCDESYELNGAKKTSGLETHPKRKK